MGKPTRWVLFIMAAGFAVGLSYPYMRLDAGLSRLEVRDNGQFLVLVAHVFAAAVALVIGPLQFMPRVRAHRRIHRTLGRIYLSVGVLPSAVAAIPVAMWSGRPLTQVGLTTAAVLWLLTGGLAYRAARRRDFDAHQTWMMRNYALTFLAVTSRLLVPLMLLAKVMIGGVPLGSIGQSATEMIPIGQALGWVINLIIAQLLIQRGNTRRARERAARQ